MLDFYEKFRTQWVRECKQNGFEKHDIRIGGLLLRIRDCYRILQDYCDGKIAGIAALEEDIAVQTERVTRRSYLSQRLVEHRHDKTEDVTQRIAEA